MSLKETQGITFGIMDGVVTTLGVMIGLSITNNTEIVVAAVFITGLSDSFANASGMYATQQESKRKTKIKESALYCFSATLLTTILLVLPIIFLSIDFAVYVSSLFALVLLTALGYYVGYISEQEPSKIAVLFLFIGVSVSILGLIVGMVML